MTAAGLHIVMYQWYVTERKGGSQQTIPTIYNISSSLAPGKEAIVAVHYDGRYGKHTYKGHMTYMKVT